MMPIRTTLGQLNSFFCPLILLKCLLQGILRWRRHHIWVKRPTNMKICGIFTFKQTRCSRGCFTNTFVIHALFKSVSQWSFVEISSKHLHFQTVRARKLKFWEKVHLPPPVTCHVSRTMCHMSCATWHVPHVMCHISHGARHMSINIYAYIYILFFFTKWWK